MKHLKKRNGVVVVKNNRHIVGKGSMMKLQRHAHHMHEPMHHSAHHMTGAAISHIPTHEHSHYDTNLERLRQSLASINLNKPTSGKKYIKF